MALIFNESQTDEIRTLLLRNNYELKNCDIAENILELKLLSKTSSSDTAILTGKIGEFGKEFRVILKFSFKSITNNAYSIEGKIYKRLSQYIVKHQTPHVMAFITYKECKNFMLFAKSIVRHKDNNYILYGKLLRYFEQINLDDYDLNTAQLLIIEKGQGESLGMSPPDGWVFSKERTIKEWKAVLFQVYYTLSQFSIDGIRHNDIHLNNIWIDDRVQNEFFIYFISFDTYYVIPVNGMVKIFDFDNSSIPQEENTYLTKNQCPAFGMCNSSNDKFDSFTVAWYLFNVLADYLIIHNRDKEAELLTYVFELIVPNPEWRTKNCCRFPSRICVINGDNLNAPIPKPDLDQNIDDPSLDPNRCIDKWNVSDTDIRSPLNFIKNKFFDEFKHTLPEFDPKYIDHPHIYALGLKQGLMYNHIKKSLLIMDKLNTGQPLTKEELIMKKKNNIKAMKNINF